MLRNARERWGDLRSGALQDALRVQAGVGRNIDTNRAEMQALVTSSQSATGALQATQAGNQLLALQAQQLADLTGRLLRRRAVRRRWKPPNVRRRRSGSRAAPPFLAPGRGYQPHEVRMFRQ
jgi:P-type conjugative transfer protein TrbJ